jgi:hypothetical protein
MKKILVTVLVLVVGFMLISPTIGSADPWNRFPALREVRRYTVITTGSHTILLRLSVMKDHSTITTHCW